MDKDAFRQLTFKMTLPNLARDSFGKVVTI